MRGTGTAPVHRAGRHVADVAVEWSAADEPGAQAGVLSFSVTSAGGVLSPEDCVGLAAQVDGLAQRLYAAARASEPLVLDSTQGNGLVPTGRMVVSDTKGRTRRVVTTDFLAEVADVYASNPGTPAKAVREHFGVSPAQASRYVERARAEGLIPERSDSPSLVEIKHLAEEV